MVGGAPPVEVRARFTVAGAAALEGDCAARGPVQSWRGVDAGTEPQGDCWTTGLRSSGGGHFEGSTEGGPFLPNTTLHYLLEATDADGARVVWPADGPAQLTVVAGAPTLLHIAPSEGPLTGGTRVALRGTAFDAGLQVRFGARPATEIEVVSAELALALTPPGEVAGAVDVVVETENGTHRQPEIFHYRAPPEVLRVAPPEGPATQETLVVIDGRHFQAGAVVLFGDVEGTQTEVLDSERLSTIAPPHEPATVAVVVRNPDDQSGQQDAAFTWWPAPEITAVVPERGPDLGGTPFRVEGRHFRAPATIWLGVREATQVVVAPDGQSATGVTGAHPAGPVELRLYNPDGQWGRADWRYVGPPTIESADPPVVSRCGGGVTTIVGRNFEPGLRVRLNGLDAEVLEIAEDGTRITVRAPAGLPGPILVEVENPDGRTARSDAVLVYGIQPVVRAVAPDEVPVWGGVLVRVEGADLEQGVDVLFDAVPAERVVVRAAGCEAVLEVVVPPHPAGPADVTAVTAEGARGTLPDGVLYVAPTLDPPHGLVPGYANLILRGVDLRAGLRVAFGDRAPRVLERISDEAWRVLTPPGEPGPVAVEVRNADGRGVVLAPGFTYRLFVDETTERLDARGDCNDAEVADLDGDGQPDVAVANGGLSGAGQLEQSPLIYFNENGRLRREALAPVGNGLNIKTGDPDGDGDLDLMVANLSSPTSDFFRNQGRGRFAHDPRFIARASAYDTTFLDLEGDGDDDLLLLRNGTPENNAVDGPDQLFESNAGRLTDVSDQMPFDLRDVHDHDVEPGDLDGDGVHDLVVVVDNISQSFDSGRNRLLLNDGRGRFREVPSPFNRYPGDWLDIELADIDADGDLDVLLPQDYVEGLSRPGTPAIAVFLNDGAAGFEEAPDVIRGLPPLPIYEIVATDLDGDGDLDLAVAVYGYLFVDGSIEAFRSAIMLNDGTGTFFEASSAFEQGLDIPSADFADADFDGDGALDLLECAAQGESRLWMQRDRRSGP